MKQRFVTLRHGYHFANLVSCFAHTISNMLFWTRRNFACKYISVMLRDIRYPPCLRLATVKHGLGECVEIIKEYLLHFFSYDLRCAANVFASSLSV